PVAQQVAPGKLADGNRVRGFGSRVSRAGPSPAAGQSQTMESLQRSDRLTAGGPPGEPAPPHPPKGQVENGAAAQAAANGGGQAVPPPPPPAPTRAQAELETKGADASVAEVAGNLEARKLNVYDRAVNKISLDVRIAAPGGRKIWSVGPGGQIFHSGD